MVDLKSLVPWRNNNKSQTPAVRDDFFDPFVTFRREMDRMFEGFFGGAPGNPQSNWRHLTPAVDVDENEKEIIVTAELPGITDKDVEVGLAGDILTIKGEKHSQHEQKNGDSSYTERRFGSFSRVVRLPFEAGEEAVDAMFGNGVLTVRIPKPAHLQRAVRRIEVRAE